VRRLQQFLKDYPNSADAEGVREMLDKLLKGPPQ
jgi:hypothetical protein